MFACLREELLRSGAVFAFLITKRGLPFVWFLIPSSSVLENVTQEQNYSGGDDSLADFIIWFASSYSLCLSKNRKIEMKKYKCLWNERVLSKTATSKLVKFIEAHTKYASLNADNLAGASPVNC